MNTYSNLADATLIALMSKGDNFAFTELYNRYWEQVLFYAAQKTEDMMEAENIVQDVFVSLWRRRTQLEINSEFKHYLIVSVKYGVIKFLNRQRTKRQAEEHSTSNYDVLDDSTQQYLDFEELRDQLEEMIARLPEKIALIYRMNKEEGMSHRDIAQTMGMSEKAINSHLVRTKKILRAGLDTFLSTILL